MPGAVSGHGVFRAGVLTLLLWLLFAVSSHAAQRALDLPPQTTQAEAWLVTYGPGEIYWQRFGHNAIWLREPEQGIDHVFNFGYFDFRQPNFLGRFIMGRMLYFSAAQEAAREFAQYQSEHRTIRAQRLQLDATQYARLRAHLLRQVQPEHRDYLYDYYLDNCSTRIRDALDLALNGTFSEQLATQAAAQNFRDHTRRAVATDFWYYLGLEGGLGRPVDRPITAWDEMFLPAKVAHYAANFETANGPLAGPSYLVYRGALAPPPKEPQAVWWRYLGAGFGVMLFFALVSRVAGPVTAEGSALAWLLVTATLGGVLAFLWFGTDHDVVGPNANILLLNPLFLLGLVPALRRATAWLMLGGLAAAALQGAFPGQQYNLDAVAFLAPLHLACAWWLLGRAPDYEPWFSPPGQRGQTTLS